MTPAKIYNFVVPAGGSFQLQALGEYFKILAASGAMEVRGDTFGTVGLLAPGQGLEGMPFARLEFRDLSGFANTVSVVLAGSNFVDDRVQGVVEIVDGNKARTLAGGGYQWRCSAQVATAGNRPFAQLWNPPGSGVRAVIDGLMFGCTVATAVNWGASAAALPVPALNPVQNVLAGAGVAAKCTPLVQELATFGAVSVMGSIYVGVSGSSEVALSRPVVLLPGAGFTVYTDAAGAGMILSGCIQFFEEVL